MIAMSGSAENFVFIVIFFRIFLQNKFAYFSLIIMLISAQSGNCTSWRLVDIIHIVHKISVSS